MKLLVHACCAPCSIMPTRLLVQEGHDITVLYSNSNIAPESEYEHRLSELKNYGDAQGFTVIEDAYVPEEWEEKVAPIGEAVQAANPLPALFASRHAGEQLPDELPATVAELLDDENRKDRCRACYRMRLAHAADYAVENGFEGLSTTLSVSPYQFTDVIREELERACTEHGIQAVFEDFRPYYDEATRISRELGMYRQNYCGCRFSVAEGQATRAYIKEQRARAKAQSRAERAEAEQAQRAEAAAHKAEKQAYADKRARQRAVLKSLRENKDSE